MYVSGTCSAEEGPRGPVSVGRPRRPVTRHRGITRPGKSARQAAGCVPEKPGDCSLQLRWQESRWIRRRNRPRATSRWSGAGLVPPRQDWRARAEGAARVQRRRGTEQDGRGAGQQRAPAALVTADCQETRVCFFFVCASARSSTCIVFLFCGACRHEKENH